MEEVLLRKLIEKKFFAVATEVNARNKEMDLSGVAQHMFENNFTVSRLLETKKDRRLLLDLYSTVDGSTIRVTPAQITQIDGMTPIRFAENYMIAPDGGEIKVIGKRRGRRPKNWNPDDYA